MSDLDTLAPVIDRPVGVVWRPDGVLALEGHAANSIGSWISGKVRAKRPGRGTS